MAGSISLQLYKNVSSGFPLSRYIGITLSVRYAFHIPCKLNFLMDIKILMKLTQFLYARMCMKEDNPSLKHFKGDNYLYGTGILCNFTNKL